MQGHQGQRGKGQDPRDRSSTSAFRLSELSGRQPAIPQRPPGMTHLDQPPPPTPRVARPQREEPKKRKRRSFLWWVTAVFVVIISGIVIGGGVYGITNFFLAVSASAGSANTATDFLANLKDANYDQAYSDLDATITVDLSQSDFKQMAQADDHCYGQVTDYNEVNGSATSSADGNTQSFVYDITRSKLAKSYQLRLNLHKSASGDWTITNYEGDLGPAPPSCK